MFVSLVIVAVTGTRRMSRDMAQGSLLRREKLCVPLEKLLGGVQEPEAHCSVWTKQAFIVVSLHPSLSALSTPLKTSNGTSEL